VKANVQALRLYKVKLSHREGRIGYIIESEIKEIM